MGEKYVQEEFLGEESLGEKSVQEEFLGEESLGEKYMGEKYVQEKKLGEESLCEKYMGEKSVQEEFLGEKSLGEKYMGEMYWRVSGWKVWWKIGVDGMLAFVPPFSGFNIPRPNLKFTTKRRWPQLSHTTPTSLRWCWNACCKAWDRSPSCFWALEGVWRLAPSSTKMRRAASQGPQNIRGIQGQLRISCLQLLSSNILPFWQLPA